jgi:hypothetical protein
VADDADAPGDEPGQDLEHWVRYFAAEWSAEESAEIQGELERRGVPYVIDGDSLCVARQHERMLDMLVESVTEE